MEPQERAVTGEQIARDLRALGLRRGDTVLVHSSLSRIGWVEGGAPAVVQAFLDVLGFSGTLAVPTFPFTGSMLEYVRSDPLFDAEETPSRMGAITEAVRLLPRAVRSLAPTHPVSAVTMGGRAVFLTEDHLNCRGSCDEHSPFWRLGQAGGKVLLLGVDFRSCTLLHTAEELARVPFIDFGTLYPLRGRSRGREYAVSIYCHSTPISANFPAFEPLLARRGLLTTGRVGAAECRLFDAAPALDVALGALRESPLAFRRPVT